MKPARHGRGASERPHVKEDRKAKQLCRQVAQTLEYVLSGDCADELLQCLHIVSVVPATNASRLLVTVTPGIGADEPDYPQIAARLTQQSGRLRAAIAAAISRKRVPLLAFQILASPASIHVTRPTWREYPHGGRSEVASHR